MKSNIAKTIGLLAATGIVAGLAMAATAAQASVQGRENTAIALGLGTVFALSQRQNGAAAVLGVGTAIATQQYEQARHGQYCADGRYDYRQGWNGNDRGFDRFHRDDRGGNCR